MSRTQSMEDSRHVLVRHSVHELSPPMDVNGTVTGIL